MNLNPGIQLLEVSLLTDFPSGSSINCHNQRLYLIGDDATHIQILDLEYRRVNSIKLFDHPEKRIPKLQKVDLEASTLVNISAKKHLLAVGSASRDERKNIVLIPIESLDFKQPSVKEYYYGEFVSRLVTGGIVQVNIEGATSLGDRILLANRGNRSCPSNHIIVTVNDFWERQKDAPFVILQLALPEARKFLGVSELHYSEWNDLLFITFSCEDALNSYDDGAIGDSYVGWISNASQRLALAECPLDGLINLVEMDSRFANEKIEGICVESVDKNEYILHLLSDNDSGETKLFKIRMTF